MTVKRLGLLLLVAAAYIVPPPATGYILRTWGGSGAILLPAYTVSTLPTCNSGEVGTLVYVSDSVASPVYGAAPTGGGSLSLPVFCESDNGTYYWTNH